MSNLSNFLIDKDRTYIPIWFMRQAGRYLPEFRKIRKKHPDFMKLCLNSDLATEITLQPINRFNLDAAIIFSDILVIPYAFKQKVIFKNNDGPKIDKFQLDKFLKIDKSDFLNVLKPVYDAIKKTRKSLDKNKSLIAFIGAPWTLIIYLLNLKTKNNILMSDLKKNKEKEINIILEKLIEFLKYHIQYQKEAGADVLQIFDSWAGLLHKDDLNNLCIEPNKELVEYCKKINIPVICFPKGLDLNYKQFIKSVKPDGINIDYNVNPKWASENLTNISIQGGLRPELLLKDDKSIFNEVDKYLEIFKNNSYIFNLGHGILPKTNPETVKKIVNRVKKFYK